MDLKRRIGDFLKMVDRNKAPGIIYSGKIGYDFLKNHITENIPNKNIEILKVNKDTPKEEIESTFITSLKDGRLLFLELEKFVPKALANYLYQLYTSQGIMENIDKELRKITPHQDFILLALAKVKGSENLSEDIDKYFNYRITL